MPSNGFRQDRTGTESPVGSGSQARIGERAAPLYPVWPAGGAGLVMLLAVVALSVAAVLLAGASDARARDLVNDADDDGVVDTADVDDDNDGVPDRLEIESDGRERDSDGDGMPDRLDLDSDNDGILDWQESGAVFSIDLSSLGTRGGRLVGVVGDNGLLDLLEAPVDSGRIRHELANSDAPADQLPDMLDLDSDNDGLSDLHEAGVPWLRDADRDGRIDAPIGSVGADGIADYLQAVNDASCCDVTGDGREDVIPLNSDLAGLPDYLDDDSDDDGVSDILEAGGTDVDGDARVDDFIDNAGRPDGYDDAYRAAPLYGTDLDANGLLDHRDAGVIGSPVPGDDGRTTSDGGSADEPEASASPRPLDTPGLTQVPVQDEPDDGTVQTGLNASGCSIASTSPDGPLLAMLLLGISALACRRKRSWRTIKLSRDP